MVQNKRKLFVLNYYQNIWYYFLHCLFGFFFRKCVGQRHLRNLAARGCPICYTPREWSSGGYIEITLSVRLSVCLSVCVRLSVQIRVRPITFLWFDIGLPYLAHGRITMRRCVAYIDYRDTSLNFDLKVKFIGFLTCFRVRPITFFLVWHWPTIFGTWMYHHQKMCRVHSWSRFNVDLKVKFKGFYHVFMYDL